MLGNARIPSGVTLCLSFLLGSPSPGFSAMAHSVTQELVITVVVVVKQSKKSLYGGNFASALCQSSSVSPHVFLEELEYLYLILDVFYCRRGRFWLYNCRALLTPSKSDRSSAAHAWSTSRVPPSVSRMLFGAFCSNKDVGLQENPRLPSASRFRCGEIAVLV